MTDVLKDVESVNSVLNIFNLLIMFLNILTFMTKYKLEDFKNWLDEDPNRQRGKSEKGWKDTFLILFGKDSLRMELVEHFTTDEVFVPYAEAIKAMNS